MTTLMVLTIAGERLELSRLVALSARGRAVFVGVVAVFVVGLGISGGTPGVGVRIAGAGLLGLAGWLATHDIARRTIRMRGVTQYMAVALAAGYGWLAVASGLWLGVGRLTDGHAYDATLHAVFLGFVFSMVFAHAPLIVPAVLRVRLPYHPIAYLPLDCCTRRSPCDSWAATRPAICWLGRSVASSMRSRSCCSSRLLPSVSCGPGAEGRR